MERGMSIFYILYSFSLVFRNSEGVELQIFGKKSYYFIDQKVFVVQKSIFGYKRLTV